MTTAVKKNKVKEKKNRVSFKFGSSESRKKRKWKFSRQSIFSILKVLAVVVVLAGIVVEFVFMEKYVGQVTPVVKPANLELVDLPDWVNEQLKDKVYKAAIANGEDLKIDDDVAASVQKNLESLVAWMADIKVTATHNSVVVTGRWRKPAAVIKNGQNSFYIDKELVVLDYVPMPNLHLVEIKGLTGGPKTPNAGEVWRRDDLTAAVGILGRLEARDKLSGVKKPLIYEIGGIDMSNFGGRKNNKEPHIVLCAKDDTQIIWGAELGAWQRYMEASDEQKLAGLYDYYNEHGSLLNQVKYINLRNPQEMVFQPIDKY